MKQKEYTNGEITIIWTPELCIHSGICVQSLPDVYKPADRPWIHVENATTGQLIEQINRCPSKALDFKMNRAEIPEEAQPELTVRDSSLENL